MERENDSHDNLREFAVASAYAASLVVQKMMHFSFAAASLVLVSLALVDWPPPGALEIHEPRCLEL
jgi:hypothetical protein